MPVTSLPPMPPMSGPVGGGTVANSPSTQSNSAVQDARRAGEDLQNRQRQLLQKIDNLGQEINALAMIAPFAQDDLMNALNGLSEAKEKMITQLGQEIEQVNQGNSYNVPSQSEADQQSNQGQVGTANLF